MSELNVLNSGGATDLKNPYFPYPLPPLLDPMEFQARGGRIYARDFMVRGREIPLIWSQIPRATADALRQWHQQYRNGFFSLHHVEKNRYLSGRFREMQIVQEGYEQWNVSALFMELPGVAMFAYPSDWTNDAIFLEERDDFGSDIAKYTGTWTFAANANAHGGSEATNTNTNTTDAAEVLYLGYGFRFYARKASNLGILELSCTALDGTVELAGTNIDLYNASGLAAAVLNTQTNFKLGWHRVKVKATNTKNPSSSANTIIFDALEVMR